MTQRPDDEMPQFPSSEWMQAFCVELADQPDADEVAAVLDGVYRFVVTPGGPLHDERSYDVAIKPAGGRRPDVRLLDDAVATPRLVLTATYDRWRQLIAGEMDVGMAVMLMRLKVSGDLTPLVRGLPSTKPLSEALGAVDTQWL